VVTGGTGQFEGAHGKGTAITSHPTTPNGVFPYDLNLDVKLKLKK
jgi:hypothetical protein